MTDKRLLVPILACAYATIIFPLILVSCSPTDTLCLLEARPENKIFWPMLAAISIVIAVRDRSRLALPPHILFLLAYLAYAGTSVLWAFKPDLSLVRFSQQAMIVISVILPAMLATRTSDLMRGLFLCFAAASILNLFFVLGRPPIDVKFATWGYPGYFAGKNYLGYCAAVALLLSLREILYPGRRRWLGVAIAIIATALLFLSNSKTSLGLVLLVPILAWATLVIRKATRVSSAIILLSIPVGYILLSNIVPGFNLNRLSFMLYGDPTFTGRSIIWDFTLSEIARRPFLGWGYQAFWLAGPDAPSLSAPGWIKDMPNSHSGYLDTILEIGYVGFALLTIFIIATVHAIGRMADRDPARAWLVLSLALFVIFYNFLESIWMRGFEFLWVVFLIVAAEAGRYWQPSTARFGAKTPLRRGIPAPSRRRLSPRQSGQ
jgi:O-antigen ligase